MLHVLLCAVLTADDADAERLKFFESKVRPILVEHCDKCHGEKKQWSGLRLDSRAALLAGGDSGPAVDLANPDASLLLKAVRHADDAPPMPKDGKLPDEQIAVLASWISLGAPFPESATRSTRSRDPNHWSFQPPQEQAVPETNDRVWPENDVDRFILVKLEAAGIAPAAPAEPRILLRRLTFDLTGLPPSPEELDAFGADASADAYERAVDRLLASPAYGERWGRRWLDVARYADSNGLDENVCHGHAWRFRDYVVDAFNADLPYDRFVVEQLAGDLTPDPDETERRRRLVATGFLAIGPKVLAEADKVKMRMDIVDEQIDAVGRVFMGLTLGCARCHDHKFDPIATADYYGLAGVFKSTKTMESYVTIGKWWEHPLPTPESLAAKAAFDQQLTQKKDALAALTNAANDEAKTKVPAGEAAPADLATLYSDETKAKLKSAQDEIAAFEKTAPQHPAAMGVTEDEIADVPIHVRGSHLKLGDVVARRTPPVVRGPAAPSFSPERSGRLEFAQWLVDSNHPLTARVIVNRVWRWHFGRGLVGSTDNFGLLGETPSHPELLDWLARRFIADGWSIKSLHRLIVLSSVYRQGDRPRNGVLAVDPDNRLLSRTRVRRLEAEEVRDALLAVSGRIDRSFGGTILKLKNRDYFFDHTSKDLTSYESDRRSIYMPVVRNHVYDVFRLLDFPDPAVPIGDRAATTVAPQALLMLNSELALSAAEALAERAARDSTDESSRLERLFQLALGRTPTDAERAADRLWLDEAERSLASEVADPWSRRRQAWSMLAHATLAANEFVYVR